MSKPVLSLVAREPLAVRTGIVAAAGAVVDLLVAFKVPIDGTQQTAILGVVNAVVIPVVLLFVARRAVTSNARVVSRVTDHGAVVAGDAAVAESGDRALLTETRGGDPVPLVAVRPELVRAIVTIPNKEAA